MTCIMPEEYLILRYHTNYARFDILGSCCVIFARSCWKWRIRHEKCKIPKALKENKDKESQVILCKFDAFWQLFGCILLRSNRTIAAQVSAFERQLQTCRSEASLEDLGDWIEFAFVMVILCLDIGWMVFFPMTSYKSILQDLWICEWFAWSASSDWRYASPGGIFEGFECVGRPEVLHRRPKDPRPWEGAEQRGGLGEGDDEVVVCCMLGVLGVEVPTGIIILVYGWWVDWSNNSQSWYTKYLTTHLQQSCLKGLSSLFFCYIFACA